MSNISPIHIGLILDGNRRWAKKRLLSTLQGHKKGYDNLLIIADNCFEHGIKVVSAYVFSTENWKRSKTEVAYLMKLLEQALVNETAKLADKDIQLRISGTHDGMSKKMLMLINDAQEKTKHCKKGILNLCLNYGGRTELKEVIEKIIDDDLKADEITEEKINSYLWTSGLPDPDIIIRTSGEKRLSGFLPWQGVYSELYFCKKMWPDFGKNDLDEILKDYSNRQRRFGGN